MPSALAELYQPVRKARKRQKKELSTVYRLGSTTTVDQLPNITRNYLESLAHRRSQIGSREVWVRREGHFIVAVGPTRESVEPLLAGRSTPHEATEPTEAKA